MWVSTIEMKVIDTSVVMVTCNYKYANTKAQYTYDIRVCTIHVVLKHITK